MRNLITICLVVSVSLLLLTSGCAIHFDDQGCDFRFLEQPSLRSTVYAEGAWGYGGSFFHEPLW